ncbi:mycofactocin precursor MftA [Halobellus rarus]|uniref:Mycofactocin MftA n=1 Tax=Halobellus rarus TaxID=1126237 RepID=A0ABD6CSS9_9EURY|nr:mycofactocin precursor MftA [Halobellus rarus]
MSQSVEASGDDDQSTTDEPDIEEDLFEEELRIDGICGVY